ncbi:sugar phosphate isomerase/epimerase family protein [Marinicrinis lubricantis]|uniref:Sugar phosphate isomerase/epimerase family protein n=1 Tax=Marinicrinis lubricantis TaxID=2086470 RepID=A0ABW1IPV9_9BACL
MSVGALAHLFGRLTVKQLAEDLSSAGIPHIQLALWKAISPFDFSKPGTLSPGLANMIRDELAKKNVSISVLGCYLHFYHRDEEIRRVNVERFKELIRYAPSLGCSIVAAETGKNPGGDYTEQDWEVMRSVLQELAEEAERWGVFVGMEAADGHLIGTAQQLRKMLDEVPSSNIGVVMDPGNLLTTANFANQDAVIQEAFDLLGDRIIAAHAKDRIMSEDGKLITVSPGYGKMNYDLYMKLLNQYKPHVHIIMEHAKREEMAFCKQYIEQIRSKNENEAVHA